VKKLALGIVALTALFAAPAVAADLSFKAPLPPPPVFSWSGCYLGVHVGAGWQSSSFTGGTTGISVAPASGVGAIGGAQAGCNLQYRQFVIGVEGEFWGSSLSDRFAVVEGPFSEDLRSRNRWDGAISVRSGVTFDRAFIYGKLGVVWGKFDYTGDITTGPGITIRGDAIFTGVLIGVGFEYALTDNWTTKFEYNYIDYGNKLVNFTECAGAVCIAFSETVKEIKQIAKIGVNYKFSYGDTVVRASY
jgi:outer membrane immunogenic protein